MFLVKRPPGITNKTVYQLIFCLLLFSLCLTGCKAVQQDTCPATDPVWATPPEDSAVGGQSEAGYYFVNEDRSIWASAWWTEQEESYLTASEDGVKVGWFRPAGAAVEILGERMDAQANPLDVDIPCCYPTRFQSTGLYFPTEGCWEVTAKAADRALSFVIWVEP